MFLAIDNASGVAVSIVPNIGSLTEAQATAIENALRIGWSSDRIVTSDETLSLLITPPDSPDLETTFYICASAVGLNLSIMQGDTLQPKGEYRDVDTLLLAICRLQ